MKTIKVKFVGFWKGSVPERLRIYMDLSKLYDIEICDDPDYIICGCFAPYYDYCKYPQVRIMFCGENYIPDLNLVDYAICEYPIHLFDRCFYYPGCIDYKKHFMKFDAQPRHYTKELLQSKEFFASFIAGHESEDGIRGDFFKKLSEYRRVESAGTYLNNMADGKTVSFADSGKTDFQSLCKFSLCFESTKHQGFVTEKITDAFYADTIPVYFGSEQVFSIFNEKAFIYCRGREDFERTIQQIIELDQDDEKYLEMMNQPILNPNFDVQKHFTEYEAFLKNIFDQPLEEAYRRSRLFHPKNHEDYLNGMSSPKTDQRSFVEKLFKYGKKT